MYSSNLRKVGGSVMLAVPPAILEMVQLQSGSAVNISVENGRLIIDPKPSRSYTLQELLDQCDASATLPDDGSAEWTQSGQQGMEIL